MKTLWVVLWAGALALCLPARADDPVPAPSTATLPLDSPGLDACVRAEMKTQGLVGLSLAVVQNGRLLDVQGYGRARQDGPPVRPDTRFAIGSLTKQFTAACVLLLAEDGKLSVTDPVSKYYPTLTRASDIRLLDLMNQVSGYHDYYPLDFFEPRMAQPTTPEALLTEYATRPLDFAPGTHWSYTNTGYLILGRIVEKVSGESFGAFLQRRILTPLGMTHTTFQPAADAADLAQGYTRFALGPPQPAAREADGWMFSAGALYSTPADLAKWDGALMTGRVLRPASYRQMTTPRLLQNGLPTGYAAGLFVESTDGQVVLSHAGNVSGFVAENVLVPGTRSALIVLGNADYGSADGLRRFVEPFLLAHPPAGPAPDTPPLPPDVMPIPKVSGPPAVAVAGQMFRALQQGVVDRSRLGADYNTFLSPLKLHVGATSLRPWGAPVSLTVQDTEERGGLEVSILGLTFGQGDLKGLLYRAPDGQVQEFLVYPE